MSIRNSSSHDSYTPSNGDIVRSGVFKKAKTSRRKFFVLRAETQDALARLEYYDSEKKYKAGAAPKRCIPLKTCFNINKKQDTKHKHVIALYTKDDCFCVAFDTDEDAKSWLKDLLTLQHGEELPEGETPKPKFEFVWEVRLLNRGLGEGRTGVYRLCLTDKTITFLKIDVTFPVLIEISLQHVRSCGHLKNYFFLEVGRLSDLGAGEIWCEAQDTNIALNIETTLTYRFQLARNQNTPSLDSQPGDLQPSVRIRSASATESSKFNGKKLNPIQPSRQATIHDDPTIGESSASLSEPQQQAPPSATSTASGTVTATVSGVAMSIYNHFILRGSGKRRHSISGGGTGWASMANHQRTQSLPLATSLSHAHPASTSSHTPATIINTPLTDHHSYPSAAKKSQGNVGGGKCSFRERCDSMPSRPRTTSEGTHALAFRNAFRETSHSPPGETLTSPPSESTGSSHSVSEDHEMDHQRILSVLTPDEVIAEEDVSDSSGRSHRMMEISNDYLDMSSGINAPQGDYLDMTRGGSLLKHASNSASTSSVTSGTHSNDIRYRDYPLDKVQSYVSTEDDDTRPCRAYSVGSKPTDTGISSGISQNPRLRAYSVGSKAKKHFNRVLQPHLHIPGIKSNSAPLLAPNPRLGSSHGSMSDSMAHLMEIDFSINEKNQKKSKIYAFLEHIGVMTPNDQKRSMPVTSTPDGYVDMNKPMMSQQQQRSLSGGDSSGAYVDMTQGQRLIAQLEMATGLGSVPLVGHPYSPYMDMSSTNNYMDMSGSSPAKVASEEYNRQFHHHQQSSDYADMTVTRQRTNSNSSMNSRTATSPGSLCSQMSSSPHYGGVSPRISEHVPFEVHPIIRDTGTRNAEEYVEMTPGNTASIISHPRQNSTDSAENEYGDYLNMSDKINKNRSQPIDIQTISGNTVANNSSPLTTNSLLGRKFSPTGVITPRMHLPLMTYSSLPRQKNTRNSSQQDTSSGSSNTTPSSSSTMFPMSLNSPLSPNNRSSTAGTPGSMKIPPSVLNVPYKSTTRKVNEDYIMMDCSESKCSPLEGSQAEEESPYMNYCPPGVQSRLQSSDYDIIKPGGSFVGKSSTLPRTKNSSCLASPLSNHLSSVGLNDNRQNNMCFMPIREKDERMPSPKPGDVPDRLALENRTLETASMDCDDVARPYERLKSPFGISSLKTSTKSNSDCSQTRPSSTTGSEKNLSRPSSVCSEGLASRLGSSSSVYSSSSSTSTVINAKSVDQNETEQNVCLHYASLDLTDAGEEKRSPRASSETNLNENPPSTTFVYADIDFIRSDELNSRGSEPGQQPGSSVNAVN